PAIVFQHFANAHKAVSTPHRLSRTASTATINPSRDKPIPHHLKLFDSSHTCVDPAETLPASTTKSQSNEALHLDRPVFQTPLQNTRLPFETNCHGPGVVVKNRSADRPCMRNL